jgi:aspartokinase
MAVFSKASNVGLLATLKNLLAGWDAKIETDLATVTAIGDIAVHEDLRECALPVLQKITGIKGMILTPSALTLVVPEAQVDEITRNLHKALIGPRTVDDQCQ